MLPRDFVAGGRTMTVEVSGRDRFSFFKRPMVPTMEGGTQTQAPLALAAHRPLIQRALPTRQQVFQPAASAPGSGGGARGMLMQAKPRTLEQLSRVAGASKPTTTLGGAGHADGAVSAAGTREMEVQTMFRENECQTDPYTPDYFIEEGQQPEVLAILELRYGEGLPAGLGEVEMIDRVRRRKDVEANLPQGNDNASMQLRLAQLETLEKAEWEEREAHIRQLQDKRLDKIQLALTHRETKREQESRDRVETVKQQKLAEVERQLQKLQEKRQTASRKLASKHSNPCEEQEKRDVLDAHATYGARGAAVASAALVENVNASNYDVRPTLLSFVEGVAELEKSKAPQLSTVSEQRFLPQTQAAIDQLPTTYQKRRAQQVVDHLDYAQEMIDLSKVAKAQQSSIQDLYRATPRLQRPDTPTLVLQHDEEEDSEEAVLLLQRLLRGRAMQNKFFEGKERCRGLINELQAAQTAKSSEHLWMDEREAELFAARQETAIDHVIDAAQGDIVHQALDYLFKELLRQQESAKVTRLMQQAEAARASREKEEHERRAAEERLRQKEEAQYAALMTKVDATVETLLEQTLRHAAEDAASEQALHVQLTSSSTAKAEADACAAATHDPALAKEIAVCRLLDDFVVPFVVAELRDDERNRRICIADACLDAARKIASGASAAR